MTIEGPIIEGQLIEGQVQVALAEPRHEPGLTRLFAANGYGCYCRFWHFAGNSREWLARCFGSPEENAREQRARLESSSAEALGCVAEDPSGEVVGWLKLAPAELMGKLYEQRLYKALPCFGGDRAGTFTIGCLLVREDRRRRGIGRALLRHAIAAAPSLGARRLEAFPRSDVDVADGALMLGPTRLFLSEGFQVVHDFHPYPVLRHDLSLSPEQVP